jgi:GTP-binding protein
MESLPVVAISGRPNVGKSTLFNVLAGKRISIVDPTPGVTRDRISAIVQLNDRYFELIDTGGIGVVDNMGLSDAITSQIHVALQKASLILFLVDIKEGITPLDREVAEILRHYQSKVVLVANKTDYPALSIEKENFRKLGFGEPLCISATEKYGLSELRERLSEHVSSFASVVPEKIEIKIAVVGKPNVGKSSFINALAQEERVIVSEIPGTTRDSVDVRFAKDGKVILAIDTAGLKRRKNVEENIVFYSQTRARKAIRRADVVIFMLDAMEKISRIEKEIAGFIIGEYKPSIITINKWDLTKNVSTTDYEAYITKLLPAMRYAPLSFVTAKTGKNVLATMDLAKTLYKKAQRRVSTGELNRELQSMVAQRTPPNRYGKQGKIYYGTQIGVLPPTFILFANAPNLFTEYYKRYLFNQFQERLGFSEVPVRIELKEKTKKGSISIHDEDTPNASDFSL